MVGFKSSFILLILCGTLSAQQVKYQGKIVVNEGKGLRYSGSHLNTNNYAPIDSAYIYLIFGQSNVGQSSVDSIPLDSAKYKGIISNVKIYNPLYDDALLTINVGVNTNILALGWDNPFPKGFGCEASFGYNMSRYTCNQLVFYKFGVGSSTLENHWRKGLWMYDSAIVKYLPKVIDAVYAENKYPIIKSIIWIQGESDDVDSATYHSYLTSFFNSISNDADSIFTSKGLYFNTEYKKLIFQLKPGSGLYTDGVAKGQQGYCHVSSNNAILVSTIDIPLVDNIHYSWRGHLKLGWKVFDLLKN